jgi:hypothetical protein
LEYKKFGISKPRFGIKKVRWLVNSQDTMQEYRLKIGWKIGYLCTALLLTIVMAYCILYAEDFVTFFGGLIMFSFSVLSIVAVFFDTLTLGDDFIEVQRLFRRKKIKINEIVSIVAHHNQAFVNSQRAKIHVTQDFVNWREVIDELSEKVKQERQKNLMPPSNNSMGVSAEQ